MRIDGGAVLIEAQANVLRLRRDETALQAAVESEEGGFNAAVEESAKRLGG